MTTVDTGPGPLLRFIDASPTPFHACAEAARLLEAAGFAAVRETDVLPGEGSWFLVRGGTLVAWLAPPSLAGRQPSFRLVGAHTDSPNLRIKPNPDLARAGLAQLGVEVYGGPLLNSWLDRDLGIAGRVALGRAGEQGHDLVAGATAGPAELRLFELRRPLLRLPQLAIHLDREVNEKGLVLNRQQHLTPFWATEAQGDVAGFAAVLADHLGVATEDIVAWDAMVFPVEEPRVVGLREEFVSAPRIDNQLSCWAGVAALAARAAEGVAADRVEALVLFDHEEVGSASDRGADGAFLGSVLERIATAAGLDRPGYLRALAGSSCVSADCAHATNPNYVDRHEPQHQIALNGGPVLKVNSNLRYATDARTAALFAAACRRADVPLQRFVNRTDLACGSTIGPLTASAL
ncbi:MAG: M18 family aminopeptidase, partial [Acidimicrobiia bacterium]|nr:M18 family aminopeptidase [Acidimicrobiia bacterium]